MTGAAPPISESENAGRSWHLRLDYAPDFARADQVIGPIVDADLVLAEHLLEMRTVTAHVEQVDTTYGFRDGLAPLPRWCLEVDAPDARETKWEPAETRLTVRAIDREALARLVATASRQEVGTDEAVSPVALWVTAVKARLPPPWSETAGDHLMVRYKGGSQRVEVERDGGGAWVTGPHDSLLTPPIHTYGRVQGLLAQLTIDAHWSPWYEEGAAGTAAIERAVAALEAKGWRRDS
jgi:hypothetical protein